MAEQTSDLYEQQLLAVFESCLTEGKDELDDGDLLSICSKLHLDESFEELKLCISKHHPGKQTISFQEFRDGLLVLLKKFQGLITDKQHIVSSCYNLNTCNFDAEESKVLPVVNSSSKIYFQDTGVPMDENKLMHLWEKINVCLKENVDPITIQFISGCLEIPQLPKQIAKSLFARLDQNCDGLISFDEFVVIFQNRRTIEVLQENESASHSRNINISDFNEYKSEHNSIQTNGALAKRDVASVSNASVLSSSDGDDLNALDSIADIVNVISDELKTWNDSVDRNTIQSHISLLRETIIAHQDVQRNLTSVIENMKSEKEKMRIDIVEANERANLLAQEIDEYQVQLEKTKETLQRQSEQRYAEITKELSDQLNVEREIDAAALKSKDDQLQTLHKENHEMKNKVVNILQENQMLEAENKSFLSQIEKLRQSNNDLLNRIKMLDAEQDDIQTIEAKQQEQVDFFVDRIKQLQSEVILLRDQNDELNSELETLKYHTKDRQIHEASSYLAYDVVQAVENPDEDRITTQELEASEGQADTSSSNATEYKRFRNAITKDLENMLLVTGSRCILEECALRDGIAKLIANLQSDVAQHCSARTLEKSIASELEMECEERANESLRDFVVSKVSNLSSAKCPAKSSSSKEELDDIIGHDAKIGTQSKTSLRDYPPRKEEHSAEQCRANRGKNGSSNVAEVGNVLRATNVELLEIEKKQLAERCQELERSLDLLKAEYEECEDYWAAKLEEERQLFEKEQKLSDDKLVELIDKIAEYEELITPSDKTKNNGRLSPIEEKCNLEQQYIDLEEELRKWKVKTDHEISQKNSEIRDLQERLKAVNQPKTNDFYVQVPDEMFLPILSDSSRYKSASPSSVLSSSEPFVNQACLTSVGFPLLSNDSSNRLLKQEDCVDGHNLYDTRIECSMRGQKDGCKEQKMQVYQYSSHIDVKAMSKIRKADDCQSEFKMIHNITKETSCPYVASDADLNVLQSLKMKLYLQERKTRHLQRRAKQQRQYVERLLQRIIAQHQIEVSELQRLLRHTQKRLQMQVETTVDQADRLANADMLVKDLYIENACLTAHMQRLQEQCLVLTGLDMGTIASM